MAKDKDTLAGSAGAVRPLEKRVHPVLPVEPARCVGTRFEKLIAQDIGRGPPAAAQERGRRSSRTQPGRNEYEILCGGGWVGKPTAAFAVSREAKCSTARVFFADQGNLKPPYFIYGKEHQRGAAEKVCRLGVLTFSGSP